MNHINHQEEVGTKISVIIPVKNGSNYLREAIDSLLSQESVSLQIIVVDDGSSDDTVAIASSYGCEVISHPVCKGQVAAKNLLDELEADPSASAVEAMVKDFQSPEIASMPGTVQARALLRPFYRRYSYPQVCVRRHRSFFRDKKDWGNN